MAHGITESVTLSTAEPAPAPPVPQLCDGYFAKYEGEKDMAMDVTFEDEQETITGATVVPGVKMTDAPKPAAPPASQAPAPSKKADAAPASTGDAASLLGKAEGKEGAQAVIDRLMASPAFRKDYADSNNPDRAKLVEGMTQLFKQANPEQQEGEPINPVDALPDLRREAGVPHPDLGGAHYDPIDEHNFLRYVVDEGIPAETATAMTEWYGTRIVTAGWAPLSKEDEDDFRATFAGRLRPDQMDLLIRWHKEEVSPKLLKAQRG